MVIRFHQLWENLPLGLPKNIYGSTKLSAEQLCQEFQSENELSCVVLRVSRFFPTEDDSDAEPGEPLYEEDNIKVNEFLYRRVELADVVEAHLKALQKCISVPKGFHLYVISATSPFCPEDLEKLRTDARSVFIARLPQLQQEFIKRDWKMFRQITRVYSNDRARRELDWHPKHTFETILYSLRSGDDSSVWKSQLTSRIGCKGYSIESKS
jgi:UDP-glucose 4-epimerase